MERYIQDKGYNSLIQLLFCVNKWGVWEGERKGEEGKAQVKRKMSGLAGTQPWQNAGAI